MRFYVSLSMTHYTSFGEASKPSMQTSTQAGFTLRCAIKDQQLQHKESEERVPILSLGKSYPRTHHALEWENGSSVRMMKMPIGMNRLCRYGQPTQPAVFAP
jgi:hypothetical protein